MTPISKSPLISVLKPLAISESRTSKSLQWWVFDVFTSAMDFADAISLIQTIASNDRLAPSLLEFMLQIKNLLKSGHTNLSTYCFCEFSSLTTVLAPPKEKSNVKSCVNGISKTKTYWKNWLDWLATNQSLLETNSRLRPFQSNGMHQSGWFRSMRDTVSAQDDAKFIATNLKRAIKFPNCDNGQWKNHVYVEFFIYQFTRVSHVLAQMKPE